MEKLDMKTQNFTDENIAKIAEIFPNCLTEAIDDKGNLAKAIDFDLLRQELSANIVDGQRERYQINWPGKREALIKANEPINKTLRPSREESVNFDTTQNLYIEGDNLEALKLLQESYLGKVKMIYIDPPYNTGNDFVYNDNFTVANEEYNLLSGQIDDIGGKLIANTESNGRFHSDWLSMIYSRLKLARNLLKEDGVVFISIDDNEVHNLKKICDEIFGEQQFQAQVIPIVNPGGRDYKQVAVTNEYLLIYSKTQELILNEMPKDIEFKFADSKGGYEVRELRNRNPKFHSGNRPNLFYPFYADQNSLLNGYCTVSLVPDAKHTVEIKPYNSVGQESVWRWGKEKAGKAIILNNHDLSQILAKQKADGNWNIYEKNRRSTTKVKSIWDETEMRTENGTRAIRSLFNATYFDHPKPIALIKRCVQIGTNDGDIVLDFFSGSGTTAHAVFEQNAESEEEIRNFILIQLPEETDEKSEAYKAGYKTIPEIGKERIRRAGKKVLEENKDKEGIENLDIGFRVLKVDSSNMKDVYYTPDQTSQTTLFDAVDNIKEDRKPEDLLFQVLLDWGVDLMLPIVREEILGKTVFFVDGDTLAACFDDGIDEAFVKELAKRQVMRVVFKDSGFKEDDTKSNVEQIFTQLSPDTEVRAI